jgi:hypothetical protein
VIYFFYSRKREKSGREGRNIVLEEDTHFSLFKKNKVLVPMSNPETQKALLMLSDLLISKKGGEIVVLAVKDVPENMDFNEALSGAEDTLEVIKKGMEVGKQHNINFKPIIRASRNIALGIVHTAEEEGCNLIIIGFPGMTSSLKDSIFEQILKRSHTDLIILKLRTDPDNFTPKNIGVYVKDTRNISLMLRIAAAVAEKRGAKIVLFSYISPGFTKQQKIKADKILIESLQELKTTALYDVKLLISDDPTEDTINRSSEFDVLIIGKDLRNPNKTLEELQSFRIAQKASCTVALVKRVKGFEKYTQSI